MESIVNKSSFFVCRKVNEGKQRLTMSTKYCLVNKTVYTIMFLEKLTPMQHATINHKQIASIALKELLNFLYD